MDELKNKRKAAKAQGTKALTKLCRAAVSYNDALNKIVEIDMQIAAIKEKKVDEAVREALGIE